MYSESDWTNHIAKFYDDPIRQYFQIAQYKGVFLQRDTAQNNPNITTVNKTVNNALQSKPAFQEENNNYKSLSRLR